MNILSALFHYRDKPKNALNGNSYTFYLGGSTSGKHVNERSAMQMTAVYSCVRILSEAVAGLPLHLYRYTDSGGKEKATDNPLYYLLHDEPNPEMTSFIFRETLMTHLLLWGNAYAQIIRKNSIENFNRQLRKVTKSKAVFPNDDSLLKMLYLASSDITRKWTGRRRDWGQIHAQLEIFFSDRLPD